LPVVLSAIMSFGLPIGYDFGFIVDSATGQEIFVHVSGLVDSIREGDNVTYETARGKKGMNAVNVQRT
jgi:CspA family cold shock protein